MKERRLDLVDGTAQYRPLRVHLGRLALERE